MPSVLDLINALSSLPNPTKQAPMRLAQGGGLDVIVYAATAAPEDEDDDAFGDDHSSVVVLAEAAHDEVRVVYRDGPPAEGPGSPAPLRIVK